MQKTSHQVDFGAMDVSALRRYCRLNHLKPKSKTREALVTAATTHWNSTSAQEVDSVAYFLFAVKHRRKFSTFLYAYFIGPGSLLLCRVVSTRILWYFGFSSGTKERD
jgi:hypothetical protein